MKRKITLSNFTVMLILFFGVNNVWSQTVYTFTPCGAAGKNGPNQTQVTTAYSATSLSGNVTVTNGIQFWTVPTTGNYRIEAFGGQGYGSFGGRGTHISGEFTLTAGQQLKILVGQEAPAPVGSLNQYAGGGGSFVTTSSNSPLIVAGGGGGNHGSAFVSTSDASISTGGFAGFATNSGAAGTGGLGGGSASSADGGGGLSSNGGGVGGGLAYVNGGVGGAGTTSGHGEGGFGCGGGTSSWDNYRSGGGGGYSGGGGGGENGQINSPAAGGGGSFNSGTMQNNLSGINLNQGIVIFTSLTSSPNDAGISSILGITPVCTGTYPLQAIVNNFGNNLISGVTVGWSVNGILQTPYTLSTPLDTVNGVGANSQTVSLGNFTIDNSTVVKVWTSLPNNISDTVNGNDTSTVSYQPMYVVATLANAINCNGGSNGVAQATVVNNTGGGMTYSWSNGINGQYLIGVQAGTYQLTGSNGICTDTASFVITQPSAVLFTDITTGLQCNGDSTGSCILSLSGGTPTYTVSWAAGGTGLVNTTLPGGANNFTISDANGCVTPGTITIPEPAALVLTSVITPESLGNDGVIDLSVSGGTPTYSYLWSNTATSQDLNALIAGIYSVIVTDANGCTTTSSNTVNSVVGLEEKSKEFSFTLSPNPSNGQFAIKLVNFDKNNSVQIFDVLGKKVFESKNISSSTMIDLNERNGVYLVKITNGSNFHVERIIVKN